MSSTGPDKATSSQDTTMRYVERSRTRQIVRAALRFEGYHVHPDLVLRALLTALEEGLTEEQWRQRAAATMDRRFAAALFRTATADIRAAARELMAENATHVIVDSSLCRHREHKKWDHTIVSTRLGLAAPFDWLCCCMLEPLELAPGVLRAEDTAPAEHAMEARAMNTDGWMRASPEKFFPLLG